MNNNVFESFNNGFLKLPTTTLEFADIPWSKHPTFDGVELKHIITAKETGGQFSYHLVRIASNKSINIVFPIIHNGFQSYSPFLY